jgi:hypothetical protein
MNATAPTGVSDDLTSLLATEERLELRMAEARAEAERIVSGAEATAHAQEVALEAELARAAQDLEARAQVERTSGLAEIESQAAAAIAVFDEIGPGHVAELASYIASQVTGGDLAP